MSNLIGRKQRQFDESELKQFSIDTLDLLIKTVSCLERNNIPVLLDSGTALGFYRDGGVIKGDSDFDVTIKFSDLMKNQSLFDDAEFKQLCTFNRTGRSKAQMKNVYTMYADDADDAKRRVQAIGNGTTLPFNMKVMDLEKHAMSYMTGKIKKTFHVSGDIFILYDIDKNFKNPFLQQNQQHYVYPFVNGDYVLYKVPKIFVDSEPHQLTICHPVTNVSHTFKTYGNTKDYLRYVYGVEWHIPKTKTDRTKVKDSPYIKMNLTRFVNTMQLK